jgi:hypothetical protein
MLASGCWRRCWTARGENCREKCAAQHQQQERGHGLVSVKQTMPRSICLLQHRGNFPGEGRGFLHPPIGHFPQQLDRLGRLVFHCPQIVSRKAGLNQISNQIKKCKQSCTALLKSGGGGGQSTEVDKAQLDHNPTTDE